MIRWHRLLRWLRVKSHALHLRARGHTRASRMMSGWTPADHTAETIAKGKANILRRYPGKR